MPRNKVNNRRKTKIVEKPKEITLDLSLGSLLVLDDIIRKCVADKIALKLYCSMTIGTGNKSITEIPGVKNLFSHACLRHGLLGYLDWQKENISSNYTQQAIDNIIIITCGSVVYNPVDHILDLNDEPFNENDNDNTPIIHDIDTDKLSLIREQSKVRFEQIITMN